MVTLQQRSLTKLDAIRDASIAEDLVEQKVERANMIQWESVINCGDTPTLSTADWSTFSKDGVSILHPEHWSLSYETHVFEKGDLVTLAYYKSTGKYYRGGGGEKLTGALLIVAKPIPTQTASVASWLEQRLLPQFLRGSGMALIPNYSLTLGGLPAAGLYFCGGNGCVNQIYAVANGQVYGVELSLRVDDEDIDPSEAEAELCQVLASIHID